MAKYKQPCCPKCKSPDIRVDNSEQEDQIFSDELSNATALFIDAKCNGCGAMLVVEYDAVKITPFEDDDDEED